MLTDPNVDVLPRVAAIELLMKNLMHMDHGLPRGWSWKFVEHEGLQKLLEVACNIPEQCTLRVNADTRDHLAICLARLYDDMVFDQYRAMYKTTVDEFIA
uniref:Uncharacterized protein n=1 Tax=Romanomermis culicivorax TaxID=13658 RepID=A0A915J0B9_ROMCU